ncbi:MAG: glycerate kinase [Brockia lithotrophica]|nr:glycerate kinase [Brockia lithotrophica]
MRVVLAPDSFKGSLTAREVAEIWARALAAVLPAATALLRPMADGGEGTLDVLCPDPQNRRTQPVSGPTGEIVDARWGLCPEAPPTAVVEVAEVVGYSRVRGERNPYRFGTSGIGQLLRHILDRGIRRILIGLGGTATVDGGMGLLAALGAKFFDASGHELPPVAASLFRVDRVDLTGVDLRLRESELIALVDVSAPLLGPEGAVFLYGPQKGVPRKDLEDLDRHMKRFALLLLRARGEAPEDLLASPGAGAAGGLGFALALLGARLLPGAEAIAERIGLPRAIADADFVLTGEGQSDVQTLQGKVPIAVARLAAAQGKPAFLLSGSLGEGANALLPYFACLQTAVARPATFAELLPRAAEDLYEAAVRLFHCVVWREKTGTSGQTP